MVKMLTEKSVLGRKTGLSYYETHQSIHKIRYLVLIVRPEHVAPILEIWTLIQDHAVILWWSGEMNLGQSQIPCQLCALLLEAADVIGSSQHLHQILGLFNITFCCVYLGFFNFAISRRKLNVHYATKGLVVWVFLKKLNMEQSY